MLDTEDIFRNLISGMDVSDETFNSLYPESLREVGTIHFSPISVCKLAAQYLATDADADILDIGSGVGKFCLVGASCTNGTFTGVELRDSFHQIAQTIAKDHDITRATFINGNILSIDFSLYNGFYIYNPFYENLCIADRINDELVLHKKLFAFYCDHVKTQLDSKPIGTRLATYFSYMTEIPDSYRCLQVLYKNDKLKFWVKER